MQQTTQEEANPDLKKVFREYTGIESELIPILQDVQNLMGYLSKESIIKISRFLNVPESTVYGVVTFYSQFHLKPQGKNRIKLCEGTACHVRGSQELAEVICKKTGIKPGETSEDGEFSLERVACIGSCALAPAIISNDKIHGPMTPEKMGTLIDNIRDSGDQAGNE